MGYRLICLDEHVFMAVPKPMLTEFGICHRLESCASLYCGLRLILVYPNHLDEPVFMAGPKPMLTEFGIHYTLESCVNTQFIYKL